MADTGIFATTAEILRKAGLKASSTSSAEAYTNDFIAQAESYINSVTRYNWSDNYSTLNVDVKMLLKECASNLAAIYVLNYDYTSFFSMAEAQTTLNVLYDRVEKCIKLLEEQVVKQFIVGA
jgi:hypothetical protein